MRELSLEDERQIASVLIRYATGIDNRDWTLFRTCFSDRLHADYGDFGVWTSAASICAGMEELHAPTGPTLHRITNIVAMPTADGARARCYVDAILVPKEAGATMHRACGYYDDQLTRIDHEWKIRYRKFTVVNMA